MKRFFLAIVLFGVSLMAFAKIELPSQVGDYMVLQQRSGARLWGWTDPGAQVTATVSWSRQKYTARANDEGLFEIVVNTPEGSYTERTVTFKSGRETVTLQHVLIGEVWLGSGQSNMEMSMKGYDNCPVDGNMQEVMEAGRFTGRIRFSMIPRTEAYSPRRDSGGPWKECTPENVLGFSATGWFFAKALNEVLDVPVGVICNAWGGSCVEGWLPREVCAGFPGCPADSVSVRGVMNSMHRPTIMYYGQWTPVRRYTYRGVIWYQGETNVNVRPDTYADHLETLIDLLRAETGQADLPFYQVEIAPYAENNNPDGLECARLRELQHKAARETENCWIVSTADLVHPYEMWQIHPGNKKAVGDRLAWMALNHTYGMAFFPGVAPSYASMDVDDATVTLRFDNVRQAGGFNRFDSIDGLEICGADQVWYPAEGRVQNMAGTVTVTSPDVPHPVAVRYAFRNWRPGNLAGANGQGVAPFRTDRILEGETPYDPSTAPDADFSGHWTGTSRMMGRETSYDFTLKKLDDGSWCCEIPGQEPREARIRGTKATFNYPVMPGMELPMTIRMQQDGTVMLEMMMGGAVTLTRK
ncbi:MAG: sialate O-acetylesterase [Bacteroidales bacterium]|jgi:sialate O-acetylesterase|nr:sialate O-acetylesterase [Bacteroidales bacterium]